LFAQTGEPYLDLAYETVNNRCGLSLHAISRMTTRPYARNLLTLLQRPPSPARHTFDGLTESGRECECVSPFAIARCLRCRMLLQLSLGPVDESDDPEDVRTHLTLEHVEAHSADQIGGTST
jgi:hypothetical protein